MDATPLSFGLDGLQALIDVLDDRGYAVSGPRLRDGAIGVGPLVSVDELPAGWRDEQEPGRYRLVRRDDEARFGWAVGPQTWKPLVHPPRAKTVTMTRDEPGGAVHVEVERRRPERRAFVGVRPCEVAAIAKLDGVLLTDDRPEPGYAARRSELFVVAVDCTAPAASCFCASMGTGPALPPAEDGHRRAPADIELTELLDDDGGPRYLARHRSEAGHDVLEAVAGRAAATPAGAGELDRERAAFAAARDAMPRRLDTDGLHHAMLSSYGHRQWAEIAERCLACGNCTAVCPTCFCTSAVDTGDLAGTVTERWREWDNCYSLEFSRVGPKETRSSVTARYRQWLVHKLGTWHDQFGESGCVGCGRCITWCPVGIDLTVEVPALRAASGGGS